MTNWHIYIASSTKQGGIYHYVLKDGKLEYKDRTCCDRPMYMNLRPGQMDVLLHQPFGGSTDGGLQSFEILPSGQLKSMGDPVSTQGISPCHLCSWQGETFVTNYMSGSVFCTSGALSQHHGHGPNPDRQDEPHTHFVSPSPDGTRLWAVDLGLDTIFSYDKDLNILDQVKVPDGHGPRHLAWNPAGDTVFCANELTSTVTVLSYKNESLVPRTTVPLFFLSSNEVSGDSFAAAIRVRDNYVYVSNRGDDSISCLRFNGTELTLCSVTPCGGAFPRDFLIVEDLLLCANEKGHCVSVLQIDGETLRDTGERLAMDTPRCIVAALME